MTGEEPPQPHRSPPGLVMVIVTGLVVAACGQLAPTDYGLVRAQHSDCQQQGVALARYLDTGQPTSDDPTYGSLRQQALALNGDARALFIRRQGDALIQVCDEQETAQAAQDAAAAVLAKERATCQRVGGTWGWSTGYFRSNVCGISYPSPDGQVYNYQLTFDAVGNVIPGGDVQSADQCASSHGAWHSDTDICAF